MLILPTITVSRNHNLTTFQDVQQPINDFQAPTLFSSTYKALNIEEKGLSMTGGTLTD